MKWFMTKNTNIVKVNVTTTLVKPIIPIPMYRTVLWPRYRRSSKRYLREVGF